MSHPEFKRQTWLDMLRMIAILSVVLCHCVEGIYSFDPQSIQALSAPERTFAVSMYTLGRVGGVPLFLMLSGYLLMDREYDTKGCVRFWKRNWLQLFVCTEVWIVLYELFLLAWQGQPIPIGYLLRAMLFLEPSSMYHMWYMPMLLGFYALLPLVAAGLQKVDKRILLFPLLLFGLYSFGVPLYSTFATVFGKVPPANQFSLGFSGGAYGIYLISGYLIKKGFFEKVKTWLLVAASTGAFVITVALQCYAYGKNISAGVWYDSPFIYICALAGFELASRCRAKVGENPFMELVSRYSFAIFLMHMVVRTMTMPWILSLNIPSPIKLCFAWDLFTLGGLLIAWLLARIPKVGKYILYVK